MEGGVDVVKTQLEAFIKECEKILTLYNRKDKFNVFVSYSVRKRSVISEITTTTFKSESYLNLNLIEKLFSICGRPGKH